MAFFLLSETSELLSTGIGVIHHCLLAMKHGWIDGVPKVAVGNVEPREPTHDDGSKRRVRVAVEIWIGQKRHLWLESMEFDNIGLGDVSSQRASTTLVHPDDRRGSTKLCHM